MDVNIVNLQTLFHNPVRYRIPAFQRRYIWNKRDQWDPLWEDVQNTVEDFLNNRQSQPTPHFLGAVVLQQLPHSVGDIETRDVVDGQQRLTTMQLLLDAAQKVFKQQGYDNPSKRLLNLALNAEEYWDDDPERAFKVWPTMHDRGAFRYAMRDDLPSDEYEQSPVVQAHQFFKAQIAHWLDQQSDQGPVRAQALQQTISRQLVMVVIDLNLDDNPHVIFETLNARGTPLLQSDLIKNMVLYEADRADTTSEADAEARLWGFSDDWWSKEVPQGRLRRPRIDVFLNYWLIMRTREEIAANDVFRAFGRYYRNNGTPISEIATDIGSVGAAYRALEEAPEPSMETFLYRWRVMQAGVLTPVLLWLLSSEVPQHQLEKSLRALESHLVRRMVCRMTTRGYNRLFIGLVDNLEESGTEYAGDTVVEYLRDQTSDVGEWPEDRQLQDAFTTRPLYRLLTRGRLRIVLEGIEEGLRTVMAETQAAPRNLTIEHVMPQQWRQHWALPANTEDTTQAGWDRDELIHSIGNLTLVNHWLNLDLSNAPWQEKQATLGEHSVLFLNKTLLDEAPEVWDEAAIAERARQLCQVASSVWPHADDF